MAPWFELVLACNLKGDIPQQVIEALNILCIAPPNPPPSDFEAVGAINHPFFIWYGWEWFTFLQTDTYYFPGEPFGKLTYDSQEFYKFTARAMVRSYGSVLGSFLHWLAPYSQTEGFVGYTRCDESSYISLIYFEHGNVYYMEGNFSDNPVRMRRRTIVADGTATEEAN